MTVALMAVAAALVGAAVAIATSAISAAAAITWGTRNFDFRIKQLFDECLRLWPENLAPKRSVSPTASQQDSDLVLESYSLMFYTAASALSAVLAVAEALTCGAGSQAVEHGESELKVRKRFEQVRTARGCTGLCQCSRQTRVEPEPAPADNFRDNTQLLWSANKPLLVKQPSICIFSVWRKAGVLRLLAGCRLHACTYRTDRKLCHARTEGADG